MHRLRHLVRLAVRAMAWSCSVFSAVICLVLGGYWLGWKSTPEEPAIQPANAPAETAPAPAPVRVRPKPRAPNSPSPEDQTRARLARLARLMVSNIDQPSADARVRTEIAGWTLDEAWSALEVLEKAPATGPLLTLRFLLMERWASLDPRGALAYARGRAANSDPAADPLSAAVLARWAFSDPTGALHAWREIIPERDSARTASALQSGDYGLAQIFERLVASNLDLALAEVAMVPEPYRGKAWGVLAKMAGQEEARQRVLAAITTLPAGDLRTETLAEALEAWRIAGDPLEVGHWLESAGLDRPALARIEERMALSESARGDRLAAADWLVSRAQTPEERGRRLRLVVAPWAREDPMACGQWLNAQGLDATAAQAMERYASALVQSHPAHALEWARRIPDESVRLRAQARIEKQIRQHHPHRVDALLAGAGGDG